MRLPFLILLPLMCITLIGAGGGCQHLGDYTVTKRETIDKQIAAARADTETKLKALSAQEVGLLKQVIAEHEARLQLAADYLFKGTVVVSTLRDDQMTRPLMVIGQSVQQTAAQLPAATPAAQAAAMKALRDELDETKVTAAALRAQYEQELAKARAEGEAKVVVIAKLTTTLSEVQTEKVATLTAANAKEVALQEAKDKVQDKSLADAAREKEEAEQNQRLKLHLMIGLGVIALAGAAAAIWVPIPPVKRYGAIVGGAAAALAITVPFLTPFYVLIALLCICVPVGLRVAFLYKRDHDDLTDTVRGIQRVKEAAPEVFKATVAPVLTEWHTKEQQQRIDQRLKETGDL